jgi:hypothetical protein
VARPTQRQIYRRRRTLLLLGLIVGAGTVWLAISSAFPSSGASQPTVTDSSPSPSSTDARPEDYPTCDPSQIELVAKVGDAAGARDSFEGGVVPLLWYEIVSRASEPCTFNVGSSVTFFTITSGAETIWSSRQCDRSADSDLVALLEPGVSKRSQGSEWLRVRSSQSGGCGEGQTQVVAGGASYHLRVEVNGVISENKQQFLLY